MKVIGIYKDNMGYDFQPPFLVYSKHEDFKYLGFVLDAVEYVSRYRESLSLFINHPNNKVTILSGMSDRFLPDDIIFELTEAEVERHVIMEII